MDTKVLNYRIIIEPELNKKTGKKVYVGFCPKLGVSDWGKTVEAAIGNIKEAIELYLEPEFNKAPVYSVDPRNQFMAPVRVTFAI